MEDTKGRVTDQGGESEEPEEDKFLKFVGKCGQIFVRSIAVIFKKTKDKVILREMRQKVGTRMRPIRRTQSKGLQPGACKSG